MTDSRPAAPADGLCAHTLALVLAGGTGTRLHGLTEARAKPAVPFGGHYRTVDFTLSNCVNSGIRRIALLTQHQPQSLVRHVQQGWRSLYSGHDELIDVWSAAERSGTGWYAGTADAVHQNRDLIALLAPEHVLVLAGDHVYSMDYSRMLEEHRASGADMTLACIEVPREEAHSYGIVELTDDRHVRAFVEKPVDSAPARRRPDRVLASMGIYAFDREFLLRCLAEDAADPRSSHDFGHSVLPRVIHEARVRAHVFRDAVSGAPGYWRDVGTIDGYWSAHMDLLLEPAEFDLFDDSWPIRTHEAPGRPTRLARAARVDTSILGRGCDVAGSVTCSVLSAGVVVGAQSSIRESVLLPGARIGRSCRLERVIVDSGCVIPDHTVIAASELPFDACFHVSPRGIVLVDAAGLDDTGRRQSAAARQGAEVA